MLLTTLLTIIGEAVEHLVAAVAVAAAHLAEIVVEVIVEHLIAVVVVGLVILIGQGKSSIGQLLLLKICYQN